MAGCCGYASEVGSSVGISVNELTMNTTGIVVRTWNDAPITRRDSDGYADATAMCQANGKLWGHYQENSRTTDYIQALAESTGISPRNLVLSVKGGPAHLQGTWIHPRLAVDLARWISPAFAVWMDGWFLESMAAPQAPEHPQFTMGVKVCAQDRRQATDLWREAVKREVVSALNRTLGTAGVPAHARQSGYPIMGNCEWLEVTPLVTVEQVQSTLKPSEVVTTAKVLDRLGMENSRPNQMAVAAALKHLRYERGRKMVHGYRQWMFAPR
jgi:hypothetical protein